MKNQRVTCINCNDTRYIKLPPGGPMTYEKCECESYLKSNYMDRLVSETEKYYSFSEVVIRGVDDAWEKNR